MQTHLSWCCFGVLAIQSLGWWFDNKDKQDNKVLLIISIVTLDHFIEFNEVDSKLEDVGDDEDKDNQGEGRGHRQVSSLPTVQRDSQTISPGYGLI